MQTSLALIEVATFIFPVKKSSLRGTKQSVNLKEIATVYKKVNLAKTAIKRYNVKQEIASKKLLK
ncbi:hypothetical protein BTO15_07410 [Polaribacter sejongensis]|uniref:Uncharacterized protein n=1 Tax=Polaribacter sejongensis TaxID=985043 RepID=A0ABN5F3D2_9FLAO|nr:hypothetical protein [Polaribacter sejongensis]AUC21937.1 hypothetical protein BTO15_07410 [Polaribacter sejongensis]